MALFESYERRIDKINAVLNSYGIASLEEAEKITKMLVWTYTTRSKASSQSVLRTLAGHISQVLQSQSKKAVQKLLKQQQLSAKVCRLSVFRDL